MVNEKVLPTTLNLIELQEQQLKSARALVKGVENQIATLKEFVRANYTGDKEAFSTLAMLVKSNVCTPTRHYNKPADAILTPRYFNEAQQWREQHEQESKTDAVPALQDGALPDQAREVPAAPVQAGAALPDVESEGGAID